MNGRAVARGREAERKYVWGSPGLPPLPDGLGDWTPTRTFDLRAVYYDTPDFRLMNAGVTLRRRAGGEDAGWHMKYPGADGYRHEAQLPLAASDRGVPTEFRALLANAIGDRPLVEIASLSTTRRQADLIGADGRIRAHACADDVTSAVRGVTSNWRELEAEVTPEEPIGTLVELDAAFIAAGCAPAGYGSKVGRALGTAGGPPLWLGTTAADVLLAYAAAQVKAFSAASAGVLEERPEAIHKSRVAARRLRSLLGRFGDLFDPDYADRTGAELRWYGEVAGGARDVEVLAERLRADLAALPPDAVRGPIADRIDAHLAALQADADVRLRAALAGPRYTDLLSALERLGRSDCQPPPLTAAAGLPGEFVWATPLDKAVRRVRRRARAAATGAADPLAWHEVRKAAKAARYCCEALAPIEAAAADTARRWEAVTEQLGRVQDTVVATAALRAVAATATSAGEPTEAYRVLIEAQSAARTEALAFGRAALDAALADALDWVR